MESRVTPTSALLEGLPPPVITPLSLTPPQLAASAAASTEGTLAEKAVPKAVVVFGPLPSDQAYSFKIRAEAPKAEQDPVYEDTFTAQAGITPAQMRELVREAMTASGWAVANGPENSLIISGKVGTLGAIVIPIGKIKIESKNLKPENLPKVAASSGVEVGQLTQGTNWQVAFSSNDEAATLEQDARVVILLNGDELSASVYAGATAEDVAFALYEVMYQNGVDVVLSDSTVEFLTSNEEEVRDVELYFTFDSIGEYAEADWLGTEITIAEREVL